MNFLVTISEEIQLPGYVLCVGRVFRGAIRRKEIGREMG